MDIRQLRYFVAVAEEQNFTRAAKRLFIAQPPLSRQIQLLEDELGVILFDRTSRPLQLTEAGKFLFSHAKKMLAKTAEIKTMTQRVGKIERSLSIGFVATTLYGLLPRIIRQFREQHQSVEITLHEMTSSQQIEALKSGKIDVGFGRLRVEDPSIRRILLREESLMVALPSAHYLIKNAQNLTLKDLIEQPLLVFPKQPRPSFADQVLALFHDRGLSPNKVIEVRELQIAIGLVAAGEGMTIVPSSMRAFIRQDVTYLELDEKRAISPVIMSIRLGEQSDDLKVLLQNVYQVYDAEQIHYIREEL
ncbi:LysR family transcriptional regulator [Rheinheimera sp. MMS21-TC3]|uniref:LysR family transcriptional regulator n=1 Tax=Rheinheimera sp. MMS21-TC3 TaxID=3072790 RepID=UPI0028C45273|nr:LysR family transcriptional regulator [Rheinheimera sp. MMS21-TC3]WNO60643.1 LysR family transcriptional regulator [Rheinheimera sp. MMS21-TC3]